jgi:hypothetical protein
MKVAQGCSTVVPSKTLHTINGSVTSLHHGIGKEHGTGVHHYLHHLASNIGQQSEIYGYD